MSDLHVIERQMTILLLVLIQLPLITPTTFLCKTVASRRIEPRLTGFYACILT